jgi:hypothetical protein
MIFLQNKNANAALLMFGLQAKNAKRISHLQKGP